MPVAIDQIDVEVEAPPSPSAPPAPNDKGIQQPETELRHVGDLLHRLVARAARLQAD